MTETFNYLLGVIAFAFVVIGFESSAEYKIPAVIIWGVIVGYAFKRMMGITEDVFMANKSTLMNRPGKPFLNVEWLDS